MAAGNDDQIAYWNEEVGQRWAAQQDRLDRLIGPFGEEAMRVAGARPGERVLDVGCGCGATTLALALAVGAGGAVLGVDVSRPMLARARERAGGVDNVRFEFADAAVAPLGGPHDLLFSRFGVMFFADPAAAFTHLHGALRAGGRMAFVCWRAFADNLWVSVPTLAAMQVLGPPKSPPDPYAPGPFAFADADRLRGILSGAGFRDISISPFDVAMQVGVDIEEAMATTLQVGPVSAMMREVGEEQRAAVTAAVRGALAAHAGKDGVRMPGAAWIVSASA